VDDLVAKGMSPSTVMTTTLPLRALYRRALSRGEVQQNPTSGLEMPAIRRNVRYVTAPEQAERLLGALEGPDRALWATAIYARLRRGERVALRCTSQRRGWAASCSTPSTALSPGSGAQPPRCRRT
jgi:site-specific recombinase XerC